MMQKIVSAVASVALLSLIFTGTAFASTYTVQHDDTTIAKNIQSNVPDLKNSEGDVPANIQPSSLSPIVIQEAKKVMGVPYVWGGTTENGFDCSGFVYYVFNKAGFSTSRYTAAGFYNRSYAVNQPQPGDLVFFINTYKEGISHVGIYLGNNQFIHADLKRGIAITSLSNSYFKAHFGGFKRLY
jgi:cell wall-associated NlpC family hydrolase